MTFLLGIAITYLDSFPDLPVKGGRKGANDPVEVHNLKGTTQKPDGAEDTSMMLPSGQIKSNVKPSNNEKKHESKVMNKEMDKIYGDKKHDGKKQESKVMNKEKDKIFDDCAYECKTDRLGNETPLYAGEALCHKQYRFGMTKDGDFLVHDCEANVKQVFYSSPYNKGEKEGEKVPTMFFKLKDDGTFRVVSKDENDKKTILYEHKPKRTIYKTEHCLKRPALGCPYLHLRGTGLVVINWIDKESKKWMDRYIHKIYPELYPNDE